jgi:hypothetical protein
LEELLAVRIGMLGRRLQELKKSSWIEFQDKRTGRLMVNGFAGGMELFLGSSPSLDVTDGTGHSTVPPAEHQPSVSHNLF